MDLVRRRVAEIQERLRTIAVVQTGLRALFWAACVFGAAVLVDRAVYLGVSLPVLCGLCLAAAGVAALAAGALRRPGPLEAALIADAQVRLKERLTSALSIAEPSTDMERALLADAQARAERIRPAEAVPFVLPREFRWIPAPVLVALLAALVLPQWDLFSRKARANEAAANGALLQDQAKRLEKKKEEMLERAKAKKLEEAPKAAQELQKLAEMMKGAGGDKKEAMAKISELSDALKDQKEKYGERQETARQLAKAMSKNSPDEETPLERMLREGKFDQAAQELDKLQKKLAQGDLPADEREKLKQALGRMGDKLAEQLNRTSPDGAGAPGLQEMAKDLSGAAQSLNGDDLKKAGDALKDLAKDLQGLDKDLAELESMKDLLQDLDQLKDDLAQDERKCDGPSGEG